MVGHSAQQSGFSQLVNLLVGGHADHQLVSLNVYGAKNEELNIYKRLNYSIR